MRTLVATSGTFTFRGTNYITIKIYLKQDKRIKLYIYLVFHNELGRVKQDCMSYFSNRVGSFANILCDFTYRDFIALIFHTCLD